MGDIKGSLDAAIAYLSEHHDEARYTDSEAVATLEEGLRVRVEGPGGESLITDMPQSVGGDNAGPSPGWLFRAALAACEATLIAMQAARDGVSLEALNVSVDSESDDRGILGMDPNVPAAPLSMRVRVAISGPGGDVETVVRHAVERCPVHDAVARPVSIQLEIEPGSGI
jgi:uncharacterized OsmC-like protein